MMNSTHSWQLKSWVLLNMHKLKSMEVLQWRPTSWHMCCIKLVLVVMLNYVNFTFCVVCSTVVVNVNVCFL